MKVAIRRMGNSQGVILPKPLLAQIGLSTNEIEMTPVRPDWARAAKRLATAGDDDLVWPEFEQEAGGTLTW
ncbi:MAG: AbrB/MazE/SpoVT family DNA-binding domain-containing protein [Vulcanimicrobiaceae bacterium]